MGCPNQSNTHVCFEIRRSHSAQRPEATHVSVLGVEGVDLHSATLESAFESNDMPRAAVEDDRVDPVASYIIHLR